MQILCAWCGRLTTEALGGEYDGSLCAACEDRLAETEMSWKTKRGIDGERYCKGTIKATYPDFIAGNA